MSNPGAFSKKHSLIQFLFTSILLLTFTAPAFSEDKIAVKTDGVEIKFNALTQLWFTLAWGQRGSPVDDQHTYKFRRSQLQFSGDTDKERFKWLMMVDFSPDQDNPLQDLYMDLSYVPKVILKAGQFKPPFLMENLTPDNQLDFVERPLIVRTFADVRDIGFVLYTKQKHFEIYGGEVNGTGPNVSDLDVFKDLVGRIVIKPWNGLAFGGSTYWLDFDHPDLPRFAGEMRIDNKAISFRSEIVFAETESVDTLIVRDFITEITDTLLFITRRNQWGTYAAILVKPWEKHQFGLRLEWYDRDKKIWRNSRFTTTLGYNFFQTSRIKWQLNFEDRVEQRGNRSNRHVYFSILNLQVSF